MPLVGIFHCEFLIAVQCCHSCFHLASPSQGGAICSYIVLCRILQHILWLERESLAMAMFDAKKERERKEQQKREEDEVLIINILLLFVMKEMNGPFSRFDLYLVPWSMTFLCWSQFEPVGICQIVYWSAIESYSCIRWRHFHHGNHM